MSPHTTFQYPQFSLCYFSIFKNLTVLLLKIPNDSSGSDMPNHFFFFWYSCLELMSLCIKTKRIDAALKQMFWTLS